jgi:tRNA threonylcarbamoyladenosine biosynthesis protein TsaE
MKIQSPEEMGQIVADFLENIKNLADKNRRKKEKNAVVVGLRGNLGSGKTLFVQKAAINLGVKDVVTSPTFVIQKTYPLEEQKFKNLVHIDAYRIDDYRELEVLKWKHTISNPENLIFIEWSDKVEKIMPKDAITIDFEYVDENTREVTVSNI